MGDIVRESSGTEGVHSPPPPAHTDSHTEVQSESSFMPLMYPTFDEWRTTIPKASLDRMTLEQQHNSYQRLIALLTRLSTKGMPESENPMPYPDHCIVPRSGRPIDVARATEDFVELQDWHHDLRIAKCRVSRMKGNSSGSPEKLAAETTKISRLKELIKDSVEHLEQQGLKKDVLFKEFTIMKKWKMVLEEALKSSDILARFTDKQEMTDVLEDIDKSILSRESQLVEEGILPLVQAPQTAKRLAANILTTTCSTLDTVIVEKKEQTHSPVNGAASPKRSPPTNGDTMDIDDAARSPPLKKRKT